jgi:hypothetical protein
MGYGLDGRGSITGREKIFLFTTASIPALRPIKPPIQDVLGVISQGVKQPRREADHSPTYISEFKKGGAIPILSMSLWHSA